MGYADALQIAAAVGNLSLIHKLVELGAKLDFDSSVPRCCFNSALQAASATGNIDAMRTLIELGSVVGAPGGTVCTALAVAAIGGYCDAIKLLLYSGAEVNACSPGRYGTTLQAAACGGKIELISLLVQWRRCQPICQRFSVWLCTNCCNGRRRHRDHITVDRIGRGCQCPNPPPVSISHRFACCC